MENSASASQPRDLPWKLVWITGASTGIGREVALQLAARGVRVAVSARSAEKLEGMGALIHAYPLDVTDPKAVRDTIAKIEANAVGKHQSWQFIRPRTLLYAGLFVLVGAIVSPSCATIRLVSALVRGVS